MKKLFIIISIIIIIFALVMVSKIRKKSVKGEEFIKTVAYDLVKKDRVDIYQTFFGKVEGVKQTEIFPDVPGRFIEYKVSEGEFVKKDQVIAYLDRSIPGMVFEMVKVLSPIEGIVYELSLNKGDFVSNQTPVCMIVDDRKKIARINVSSEFLGKIKNGSLAEVEIEKEKFTGRVIRISKYPNNFTNLGSVDIEFEGKGNFVNTGCSIKILLESKKDVFVVPYESVKSDEKGDFLFLLKNGIANKIYVKTGLKNQDLVEIVDGVVQDDTVVTIGSDMIRDGQKVKVR